MNKYARYLKELKGYEMYEDEDGFVTYGIMQDSEHKFMYIEDIYVVPEKRKNNIASKYADKVLEQAKAQNCTALLGSVVPALRPDSHYRMLVLLGYGFKLHSSQDNIVYFYKEI